jgi:lipoprotein-anchoring transpeptidase ErfK/SrfK
VRVLHDQVARARPSTQARRLETVRAWRPLTRVRTVLPALGAAVQGADERSWVRVLLPGRPNGHTGWIRTARTRRTTTAWALSVSLSRRQVTAWHQGRVERRFRAIVGTASTPTPRGRFFIEEALALSSSQSGGPYALATSARSTVLQEFAGGPGQIALHGTGNLVGTLGTAVSHGCIRLSPPAITWLARHIGAGVPLTVTR